MANFPLITENRADNKALVKANNTPVIFTLGSLKTFLKLSIKPYLSMISAKATKYKPKTTKSPKKTLVQLIFGGKLLVLIAKQKSTR